MLPGEIVNARVWHPVSPEREAGGLTPIPARVRALPDFQLLFADRRRLASDAARPETADQGRWRDTPALQVVHGVGDHIMIRPPRGMNLLPPEDPAVYDAAMVAGHRHLGNRCVASACLYSANDLRFFFNACAMMGFLSREQARGNRGAPCFRRRNDPRPADYHPSYRSATELVDGAILPSRVVILHRYERPR